jgi:hypothetical protein
VLLSPALISGSVESLTLHAVLCDAVPCQAVAFIGPFAGSEEIVSRTTLLNEPLTTRSVAPAGARARAATILVIVVFLPLLKRFYAGFYCWKAVDSD